MPVTLTIKEVPEELAEHLRQRAASNRRSLQRELLLILEESQRYQAATPTAGYRVAEPVAARYHSNESKRTNMPKLKRTSPTQKPARAGKLSLDQLWRRARALGSPSESESTDLIRRDRDARHSR